MLSNFFLKLFPAFRLIALDVYPGLMLNEPVRSLVVHKVFDVRSLIFHGNFPGLEEVKYNSSAPNARIVLCLLLQLFCALIDNDFVLFKYCLELGPNYPKLQQKQVK